MIRSLLRSTWQWIAAWYGPKPRGYVLSFVEGDELPDVIPRQTVLVACEDGELWSAGLSCPCGCGRKIEVMLLPAVEPRWDLSVGTNGSPSLSPSVWANDGCRSHFWLRDGEIRWCKS